MLADRFCYIWSELGQLFSLISSLYAKLTRLSQLVKTPADQKDESKTLHPLILFFYPCSQEGGGRGRHGGPAALGDGSHVNAASATS